MQPKRIIESLSDEELALLQTTLPEEFERRGLTMSAAVEALSAKALPKVEVADFKANFDLKEQYTRATNALKDLDISTCQGKILPTFDQVANSITPSTRHWLNERAQMGIRDELVIAPSLGELRLNQLLKHFDTNQDVGTYMWRDLWNKYDVATHNNEHKGWQVAILLNDIRQPKDIGEPVNKYGEAGLVYTDLSLYDQQKAFHREVRKLVPAEETVEPVTISQLILLHGIRRVSGEPQLDERTFTRLIQYPGQQIGDFEWVPAVSWLRGRLRLFGSEAGFGWDRFGMRRALKIEIKK